ncbi:MAG: hypothetical protein HPY64_16485 [Anaerolineae bacterium]|nr:hypothetical protein [Anaerolineae bacterium]
MKAQHRVKSLLIAGMALLAGCNLPLSAGLKPEGMAAPVTPDAYAPPFEDARDLFASVCFDYWVEQVNRLYVIDSALAHIMFYNEVDESGRCRFPVKRQPFDFTQGWILVGAVNVGTGCRAYTDPIALLRDDAAQTITLQVRWAVTGDCPYRLARPFWVSIPRPPEGYTVRLQAEPLPSPPEAPGSQGGAGNSQ